MEGYYVKEKNLATGRKRSIGIDVRKEIRHVRAFGKRDQNDF